MGVDIGIGLGAESDPRIESGSSRQDGGVTRDRDSFSDVIELTPAILAGN